MYVFCTCACVRVLFFYLFASLQIYIFTEECNTKTVHNFMLTKSQTTQKYTFYVMDFFSWKKSNFYLPCTPLLLAKKIKAPITKINDKDNGVKIYVNILYVFFLLLNTNKKNTYFLFDSN